MLAEIQAGYASGKAAFDLLKGIQALKTEAEINAAVIDIQRHVTETQRALAVAQGEYSAVLQREETLKAEILRLKDWAAEKERYERADAGQGTIAYRLKEGMEGSEPAHWLCPQCFQDGKPQTLQPERHAAHAATLSCNACRTQLITRGSRLHVTAPPGRR